MCNEKEMYLTMMRASEQAIRILIDAQRKCEEMYLQQGEGKETEKSDPDPSLPCG